MSRRFLKMMITVVTMMFIINVSSEEVEAAQEEGTMGHGYKKYIENENQNTFRNKQEIEESSTVAKDDYT